MANIELKRGHQTQVNVSYIPTGSSYTTNFNSSSSAYTGTLVIRRKAGNSYNGPLVDSLASSTTGNNADSSGDFRDRFPAVSGSDTSVNITLHWSTAEAEALPNEEVTVYGDLKIVSSSETIHSFRLTFDIIPEII